MDVKDCCRTGLGLERVTGFGEMGVRKVSELTFSGFANSNRWLTLGLSSLEPGGGN
jgi:hypothetical protein